jgi:hypothetical protein
MQMKHERIKRYIQHPFLIGLLSHLFDVMVISAEEGVKKLEAEDKNYDKAHRRL